LAEWVVDAGTCDNLDEGESSGSEADAEHDYRFDHRIAPDPVPAPKGLARMFESMFDDTTTAETLDAAKLPHGSVLLNVYDVSDNDTLKQINQIFTANGNVMVGGVFHGGIEIYGKEWCYGGTQDERTGVCHVRPRLHPAHTYKATVLMGRTRLSAAQIDTLMSKMKAEWRGNRYNLIHFNCCTFCNALSEKLGLRRIPGWVDRAARAGANLDYAMQTVKTISAEDVQNQTVEALETFKAQLWTQTQEILGARSGDPPRKLKPAHDNVKPEQLMNFISTEQLMNSRQPVKQGYPDAKARKRSTSRPKAKKTSVQASPMVDLLSGEACSSTIQPVVAPSAPTQTAATYPWDDLLGDLPVGTSEPRTRKKWTPKSKSTTVDLMDGLCDDPPPSAQLDLLTLDAPLGDCGLNYVSANQPCIRASQLGTLDLLA